MERKTTVVRDVAELVAGVGGNCLVLNDRGQGSAGPRSLDLGDIDAEHLGARVDEVSEEEDPQAWTLARSATTICGTSPTRVWVGYRAQGHQWIYTI
jgi:hypothetical protein